MGTVKLKRSRLSPAAEKKKAVNIVLKIAIYLFLLDLAYVFLYPVLYMVVTSLKSPQDILDSSVTWLINSFYTENYKLAWSTLSYPRHFLNTMIVVVFSTLGHVLACSYAAYGFARFDFYGKRFMFVCLLLSIIVPPQAIIIPIYMAMAGLNISSGFLPIILPAWLGFGLKGALFIFVFRQFYLSLPQSLEEAASIDGCGPIKTFYRIALPSSRSSIVVCVVLSIVWHWNDYFEPSIYITQTDDFLLPMLLPGLLQRIESAGGGTEFAGMATDVAENLFTEGVVMAATFIVILPVFIMYMFMQKKFVQGIERTGLTGE